MPGDTINEVVATVMAMKVHYRGFEIEARRETSLGGWEQLYFTVMRLADGWYLEDSFTEGTDPVEQMVTVLQGRVDDYYENPGEYERVEV